MTLNTCILLRNGPEPLDLREIHEFVCDALGIPKERIEMVTDINISNRLGQGFPAIVDTTIYPDQPYTGPGHETDEWWACEPDCDSGYCVSPQHDAQVTLDTGYAYRHEVHGYGCSVLHAGVILMLADWVESKGGALYWFNEYNGDLNWGKSGIKEFLGNGAEADDWFANVALPAITADIEERSK